MDWTYSEAQRPLVDSFGRGIVHGNHQEKKNSGVRRLDERKDILRNEETGRGQIKN